MALTDQQNDQYPGVSSEDNSLYLEQLFDENAIVATTIHGNNGMITTILGINTLITDFLIP
jgi:hypothetical protein